MHFHLAGEFGPAVLDQRHVGRGAAHVEGDDVGRSRTSAADLHGAHHAGGGSREHRAHGLLARRRKRHDPTVRLGDVARAAQTCRIEPRAEPLDVARHDRAEVGVDDGGRKALELAELRRHLVRAGDEGLGKFLGQNGPHARLVARVDVGIEESDGDRLHACALECVRGGAYRILIERGLDAPIIPQALRHLDPEMPPDEQGRLVALQVVEMGAALASDLQQITETLRGDQAGRCAAMLDQGIGGNGGAVTEIDDLLRFAGTGFRQPFEHAVGDRLRGIVGGARHFPHADGAGIGVGDADVGEGATGVDAHAPSCHVPSRPRVVWAAGVSTPAIAGAVNQDAAQEPEVFKHAPAWPWRRRACPAGPGDRHRQCQSPTG